MFNILKVNHGQEDEAIEEIDTEAEDGVANEEIPNELTAA